MYIRNYAQYAAPLMEALKGKYMYEDVEVPGETTDPGGIPKKKRKRVKLTPKQAAIDWTPAMREGFQAGGKVGVGVKHQDQAVGVCRASSMNTHCTALPGPRSRALVGEHPLHERGFPETTAAQHRCETLGDLEPHRSVLHFSL